MTEIPPDAISEAADIIQRLYGEQTTRSAAANLATLVLEAAAPHIAAAERERIRELAVARGATCANTPDWPDIAANTYPPPTGVIMFANLLTEGDST